MSCGLHQSSHHVLDLLARYAFGELDGNGPMRFSIGINDLSKIHARNFRKSARNFANCIEHLRRGHLFGHRHQHALRSHSLLVRILFWNTAFGKLFKFLYGRGKRD